MTAKQRRRREVGHLGQPQVRRGIIAEMLATLPICYYCSATLTEDTATLDHYMPASLGREFARDRNNLVLSCDWCNTFKGDKIPGQRWEPEVLGKLEALRLELLTA